MSNRDEQLLLLDMLESVEKFQRYTVNLNFDEFLEDEMVLDAVARTSKSLAKLPTESPLILKMQTRRLNGHE